MHRRGRFTGAAFFIGEHDIMCLSVRHGPGCSPDAIRDLDPVPPSLHSNLGQAMTALIGAFINVQLIRELTLLREAIAALRGSGPARTRQRIALVRSEEHTSELQSLLRISYADLCLKKKKKQ